MSNFKLLAATILVFIAVCSPALLIAPGSCNPTSRPAKPDTSQTAKQDYDKALQAYNLGAYQAVLSTLQNPQTVDECVLVARAMDAESHGNAAVMYDKAAQLPGKKPTANMYKTFALLSKKDYNAAIPLMVQATNQAPNDPELQSTYGRVLNLRGGDSDKGLQMMVKAANDKPTSIICLENLASAYQAAFDSGNGIATTSKLIKLQPGSVTPLLQRAFIYSESGKKSEALADYATALKINPSCEMAYYKRATVYRNFKDYEKAIADCDKCLASNAITDLIRQRASRIKILCEEHLNRYSAAEAHSKALTNAYSNSTVYNWGRRGDLMKRASLLEHAGKFDEAVKLIEPLYKANPNKTEVMVLQARLLGEAGKYKESLAICNKLIAIDTNMADWYSMRARAYTGLGDKSSANSDLAKAKSLNAEFSTLPKQLQDSMR